MPSDAPNPPADRGADRLLSLVIPVYNGARFLDRSLQQAWSWLCAQSYRSELLVVDDGSSDDTPEILQTFAKSVADSERVSLVLLRNQDNRGKGYSLRRAFAAARGEAVVFTDADLTYPMANVATLLAAVRGGADVAYGSRMLPDSQYQLSPTFFPKLFTRHFMGRVFNLLVRALVVPGVHDTQAGIKAFRRHAARTIARRVRLDGFSFDVEMFFVARRLGWRLAECPVLFLYRKEPSTVKFVRDSAAMMTDMLRIRWRGLRRAYDRDGGELLEVEDPAAQSRQTRSKRDRTG